MTDIYLKPEIRIALDDVLASLSQLEADQLEQVLEQVSLLLAERKANKLHSEEAALLQKINQGLAPETQMLYQDLQSKLQAETITKEEHQILLDLIEQIEQANVERLQALIALAQYRNVTLDEIMSQLNITPPEIYA